MFLSFVAYVGIAAGAVGAISVLVPLRFLGIRHRGVGLMWAILGAIVTAVALVQPAVTMNVAAPATKLDEFAPAYQFNEVNDLPVRATPDRIYQAILAVTAAEIPAYRTLAWIRRGFAHGPESILNPPDHEPIVAVALRSGFLTLAEVPGREFVMGSVVIAPPGDRLVAKATPDTYKGLVQPGYAKATMGFLIEPGGNGWCRLRTETRVFASDSLSRRLFGEYWRIIEPGSRLIRITWLRAIKVRAEGTPR